MAKRRRIGWKSAKVRRRRTWSRRQSSSEPPEEPPPSDSQILLEDGTPLLTEAGDELVLET